MKKTAIILFVIVIFFACNLFIIRTITISYSLNESVALGKSELKRVITYLNNQVLSLKQVSGDYSMWDEMYTSVLHPNEQFYQYNLVDENLFSEDNLNLDAWVIWNKKGEVVFSRYVEQYRPNHVPVKALLDKIDLNWFQYMTQKYPNQQVAGLYDENNTLMLISFSPILKSNGTGPSQGLTMVVRVIDKDMSKTIQDQLPIFTVSSIPPPHYNNKKEIQNQIEVTRSGNVLVPAIQVTGILPDILNQPTIKVDINSREYMDFYLYRAFDIFLLLSAGMFLSFYLFRMYLLSKIYVERLQRIKGAIQKFSKEPQEELDDLDLLEDQTNKLILELHSFQRLTEYQANHDLLTGLLNRKAFEDKVENTIEKTKESALLFIDVDTFKSINDTYGHHVGDYVLVEIATRMQERVSKQASIGRISGDEFIIFFPNYQEKEAVIKVAKALHQGFVSSYECDEFKIHITLSIGITYYPEHGTTYDELCLKADMAMYEAKKKGRNSFVEYQLPET